MSHEVVVRKFANREINKRSKSVSWNAGNVFCEDDLLYSYGRHFPLAKYLGERDGKPFFVKNGDRYSSSTSTHQGIVSDLCQGPTVSRRQLAEYGVSFVKITLDQILDVRVAFHKWLYRDTKTDRYFEEAHTRRSSGWGDVVVDSQAEFFVGALEDKLVDKEWLPPAIGSFVPAYKRGHDSKDRIVSGSWRVLGAVLLKGDAENYFCTDGKCSKVPSSVKTVKRALTVLEKRGDMGWKKKKISS